ncbi:MAG: hypothetical protein ACRECH_06420 [Nitrososphaerales archaeon]
MQKGSMRDESEIVSQSDRFRELDTSSLEFRARQSVNKIVRESVLSGLSHFGDKNVVDSLLYILELEHSVNMYNLAFDLSSFRSAMSAMFGTGGYILEEHVCDELAKRMGTKRNGRTLETLVTLLFDATREKLE